MQFPSKNKVLASLALGVALTATQASAQTVSLRLGKTPRRCTT